MILSEIRETSREVETYLTNKDYKKAMEALEVYRKGRGMPMAGVWLYP